MTELQHRAAMQNLYMTALYVAFLRVAFFFVCVAWGGGGGLYVAVVLVVIA